MKTTPMDPVVEYTTSGTTVNASLISGLYSPAGIAVVELAPELSTWTSIVASLGEILLLLAKRD